MTREDCGSAKGVRNRGVGGTRLGAYSPDVLNVQLDDRSTTRPDPLIPRRQDLPPPPIPFTSA